MNYKRIKKGFTLTEVLLAIGISAIIIITIFIAYPRAVASKNARAEVSNISTVRAGMSSMFAGVPLESQSTSPNMNVVFAKAGIIPDDMIVDKDSGVLENLWGGDVYLGTTTLAGKKSFAIQYNFVPVEECVKMVTAAAPFFDQIVIAAKFNSKAGGIMSGGGYTATGMDDSGVKINFDPAKIVTYCRADTGSTDPRALIIFKFY